MDSSDYLKWIDTMFTHIEKEATMFNIVAFLMYTMFDNINLYYQGQCTYIYILYAINVQHYIDL